jgi:hypothetical protein
MDTKKKDPILEDGEGGGAVGTTTASVLGTPGSPTYGGYIGPLGKISRKKLNTRLATGYTLAKTQLTEHVYSIEGKMVTEKDLQEWFGADLKQKPSWNGGKLVAIEPKCLAFPYCNQGSIDNPIKLIGESKEHMCEECYDYVSYIGKETGKTPETIAKIIRERYL